MYNFLKTLLIAFGVVAVLGSCKDDEQTKVNVSEVVGSYAAVAVPYLLNANGTITNMNGTSEIEDLLNSIEIDLIKISVNGNKVTAKDSDSDLVFESTSLVEASNGVVWNLALPAAFISEMQQLGYTVTGFTKYEMEGKKYQAFYDAKEQQIDFSLLFISSEVEIPDVVLEIVCTK